MTGSLSLFSPVTIKGRFTGDIISKSDFYIKKSATLKSNITAKNIIIEGTVEGNCIATQKISLSKSAFFKGNLKSSKLKISDGAKFHGISDLVKK